MSDLAIKLRQLSGILNYSDDKIEPLSETSSANNNDKPNPITKQLPRKRQSNGDIDFEKKMQEAMERVDNIELTPSKSFTESDLKSKATVEDLTQEPDNYANIHKGIEYFKRFVK